MDTKVVTLFPRQGSAPLAQSQSAPILPALQPSLYVEVHRIRRWFWWEDKKLRISMRTRDCLFNVSWSVEVEDNSSALDEHLRILEAGCKNLNYRFQPIRNDLT
jgi:hypothetical protein